MFEIIATFPAFYGMELLTITKCPGKLKKLAVSYHAAIKGRQGLPNAMATICLVNVLTFEHFEQYIFWIVSMTV